MKTRSILLVLIFLIPVIGFSQDLEMVDYISPFNDDVAAVKKGSSWAFIDDNGMIVVDFRKDFVISNKDKIKYPIFNDGRSLIQLKKKGITYFGYIDKSGKVAIEPQFLNATNFQEGHAIVLELVKQNVGTNELLEKPLVSYDYFEAVINTDGEIVSYLVEKPIHITLDKEYIRKPPPLTCKLLSKNLIAKQNKDRTWSVRKIE